MTDSDKTLLVDKIRRYIRHKGYVSAMELAMIFSHELSKPSDIVQFCENEIPNDEIRRVEYAKSDTADYRRKDLFYYNPDGVG